MEQVFVNNRLRLAITNRCNFSCFYCHNEGQTHFQIKKCMSISFVKNLKKFIIKNNIYIEELSITGGEPLLHPDLIKIVKQLKGLSNKLSIITNGSLLTIELVDKLIKAGINKFKFGVDTLTQKQSKYNINPMDISVNDLLDVIVYTQNKLYNTQINIVVINENFNEIPQFIEFAKLNKIKCLNFIELINCGFRGKEFKIEESPTIHTILSFFDSSKIKIKQHTNSRIIFDYDNILIKLSPDFCTNQLCQDTYSVLHENAIVLCHKNHINKSINLKKMNGEELKKMISEGFKFCKNSVDYQ